MVALETGVRFIAQMLQRTSAAFTILAAARGGAIGRGCHDFDNARAVTVDLGAHGFAGQGERHENLPAIMHGDPVALCAKALDMKLHGLACHARLQAGSIANGQLRAAREG